MFEIFDQTVPLTAAIILKSVLIAFVGTVANYFMLTVPAYYYVKKNSGLKAVRLQEGRPFPGQIAHEIRWSMSTIAIYSVISVLLIVGWRMGYFPKFYLDPLQYGLMYLAVSIVIVLLVQDFYFYLIHRLLHTRRLIRFHGIHHRSKVPTPFVMYAFHPVEAALHAIRLPIMLVAFPVNLFVVLVAEGFISNVIIVYSHTNHEPRFMRRFEKLHGWSSATSTYHDLHHSKVKGNYGFYLKIWDKIFGTWIPETQASLEKVRRGWLGISSEVEIKSR